MARTVPFVPREYHLAKNSKELLVATMDTLRAIKDYRDAGVLHGHITTMSIMHVDLPEDAPARYDGIRTRGILLDLDDSDEFVIPDKQPMPKQAESSTQLAVVNEKLPILPVD